MANLDTFEDIMEQIIKRYTRFAFPRLGIIKDLNDPDGLGRVLCHIPAFGWETNDIGVWAYPINKNEISTPAVDDYTIVIWLDGREEFAYYISVASHMKNMLPQNYDADPKTHVLFESPENKMAMIYKEGADELTIGKSGHEKAARENDTTTSDASIDSTFWSWITTISAGVASGNPTPNTPPTSLASKINSGSEQVKIGDK